MTNEENLRGMGTVVINTAFVLQLSWIPMIFLLEGANWVDVVMALAVHRFALAFMVAAPLAYGGRLKYEGGGSEVLKPWLLRCLLPLSVMDGLIYWIVKAVPSLNLFVIGGMMVAGIVIALYGVAIRYEGRAAVSA